ncbi:MAG: hypothetical protein INH41_11995 [Myxococcaceae bacterium]|nr:hypothetical protein [Myxococcaceae bacterium]MCA3013106.1 hypothetical protein [Myxococcaceae bacterium]
MSLLDGSKRFLVPALLVVGVAGAYFVRAPVVKRSHGPCLTHDDCPASERCLVSPAADGFASVGECADPCADDLQCPARHRCERADEAKDFWRAGARPGTVGGCLSGVRADMRDGR